MVYDFGKFHHSNEKYVANYDSNYMKISSTLFIYKRHVAVDIKNLEFEISCKILSTVI